MNTRLHRSPPARSPFPPHRLLATAALLAAAMPATAQITDVAVVDYYGNPCGVALTATDTIVANAHAVNFRVGTTPNAPALLVLGLQQVDVQLPDTGCHLLAEPLHIAFAVANGAGDADFPLPLPGTLVGSLYAQGATFDASLVLQTSRGAELTFVGQSPTVDPATHTEYPCAYVSNLWWNYGGDGVPNVQGRVWWPSATCNAGDGPPTGRPVVMFLHGNGMSLDDHDDALAHLARNGYVVCSIANGSYLSGSNEGRARQAISYLNGMHAFWGFADRLSDDVVFAGHSRGGEAALTAARLLRDEPSLMHLSYDVQAVMSLAPTDGGGDNSDPKEHLAGDMADSFLALYGSRDPDVRGIRLEDGLSGPENTAFAIYDRAGTEGSIEGLLLPANNVTKCLLFVEGATHRGFLDGCNVIDGGGIGCDAHRTALKAYWHAFLRWRVGNDNSYRAYFDGRAVPASLRAADVGVATQFRGNPVRVLDNFEQNGWNTNTRGGSVVVGAGIAAVNESDAWLLEPSAPHSTQALRVRWNGASSYVGWSLPAAAVPLVGQARDVSNYDYLSVRIAQCYLDPWNVAGQDQDFRVRLYTGNGWSSFVLASDHGRVAYPSYFYTHPFPYPAGDFTKSAMVTLRIPLSAFGADLTDVRNVYVYFDVPGHTQGAVLLDSLEFLD